MTAPTIALEHTLKLSDAGEQEFSPEEVKSNIILGQQALFFLTLFDMGSGENPNYRSTLTEAQKEFSESGAFVTQALAD